jgi:MFS family permease
LNADPSPPLDAELPRLGKIAGVLFIAASLCAIPSGLLIEPRPPASDFLVALSGMAIGIGCLLAPWERMSRRWLHVVILVATVLVAIGIEVFDEDDYSFFYVIVGIYAAYVSPDRRALAIHLAVITAALLAPLVLDPQDTQSEARHALVTLPVMLIGTVAVYWQRIGLEAREASQRAFAAEAIELAMRIRRGARGTPLGDEPPPPKTAEEARLEELAREAERLRLADFDARSDV